MTEGRSIAFRRVADAALPYADRLCRRWVQTGRQEGVEWVCRNPRRADHRAGSFKINVTTGRWADFATGDSGGDLVSLGAYLFAVSQRDAALKIADMLGVDPFE